MTAYGNCKSADSHRESLRRVGFVGLAMVLGMAFVASTVVASALPPASMDNTAGVPGARALRLSNIEGQARVMQDGQIISDPALENQPIFEGSEIQTGNDGRAEVQLEDGSIARLSPNTTISFTVLQREGTGYKTQIAITAGLAYLELQPSTAANNLRVTYGSTAFAATSFSVVRINMDAAPGLLAVFSGNIHLERGNDLQLDVHNGESVTLDNSDLKRYVLNETIEPDSWDGWNADRDQALNALAEEKTAASGDGQGNQAMGMADLDANGNWYNVPDQGYVWSPYDAQNSGQSWDPYGYGNWVYYPRFGYVFVSGYNWGYAPFACGTWNYYDSFGWGWMGGAGGLGCNPWWGNGGGWGYNIGTYPRGYRPPRRPNPEPVHPHMGTAVVAHAAIPVGHKPEGPPNGSPAGHSTAPVVIAGHIVQPLSPITPRQPYDRGSDRGLEHGSSYVAEHPGAPGQPGHPTFIPGNPGARPVIMGNPGHSAPRPSAPSQGHAQSSGGGASHASSGGGGGGGSHGGGGGGGGGGSHK